MENKELERGGKLANARHRIRAAAATLVTLFLLSTALLVFPGTARAGPSPTPNGFVGACNMLESWPGVGPGVPEEGGMEHAMDVDASQGNDGMNNAVTVSGGSC